MLSAKGSGGASNEGMYVWKKYAYTTPEFNFTQQSGNPYWIAISDIDDSGYHISDYPLSAFDGWIATNGSATFYFTYSDNKLYFGTAKGSTSRYVYDDTTQNGIRYWQPSENGLTVPQNATFKPEKGFMLENSFDYIVSDNASAYPDGDVQNGYYYEKVEPIADILTCGYYRRIAIDEFTPTSVVSYPTIPHSLGEIPKAFIILSMDNTNTTNCLVSAFCVNNKNNLYPNMVNNLYDSSGNLKSEHSSYSTLTSTEIEPSFASSGSKIMKGGITYKIITIA